MPSDFEDFWCYLFLTLYGDAVVAAAALAALVRFEEIRNALCLLYATL